MQQDADLIALGATRKGALQALLVGSVARAALTHARQSLLIAHTPPPTGEVPTRRAGDRPLGV
jgi:nucleotide-binding universal stress UspA family protein